MTKEHVFPMWVTKLLGTAEMHRATLIRSERRDWPTNDIGVTVFMPCAQCNNGWMSDFETRALPLLTPMMTNGKRKPLTLDDRKVLAGWTAKTVTVLEYLSENPPYYTDNDRSIVKERLVPPDSVWIWIGRYLGRAKTHWTIHRLPASRTDQSVAPGHCVTMSLGQLVIQMLSYRGGEGHSWEEIPIQAGPWASSLHLVWPIVGEQPGIVWPPAHHFNDDGLAKLCARFTGGPPPRLWRVSRGRKR